MLESKYMVELFALQVRVRITQCPQMKQWSSVLPGSAVFVTQGKIDGVILLAI